MYSDLFVLSSYVYVIMSVAYAITLRSTHGHIRRCSSRHPRLGRSTWGGEPGGRFLWL